MAKVSQIRINGIDLLNGSQRIDWTKFKNTPSTLVSASGHDHNAQFYANTVVDSKFKIQEDRISLMETQIETLAYKTDLMMGGGGTTTTAINNYNLSTEVTSQLTTTLNHSPLDTPGISTQSFGYFLNSSKVASKFDYFTLVNETIPDSPISAKTSIIDFAIQTKGLINDGASSWAQLDTKLDVWSIKPNASADGSGRTGLSSTVAGYTKGIGYGMTKEYTYSSGVIRDVIEFTTIGITVGMSKSSQKGYWISKVNGNFEHTYNTDTVQSISGMVNNADNASTATSEYYGLIAGGGSGLKVQKLTWTTMTISSCTDLSVNKNGASSIEQ